MTDELTPPELPLEGGPVVEAPVETPPPASDILVRYRGEEKPLPSEGIDVMAQAFGTTPEKVVSWLQMQMDANRAWNEAEKYKQRAQTLEEQWQDHLRRQPAPQYQPTQQPQYAPPPQYPQPNGYAPAPQYQQPGQIDPVEEIRATRQEVALLRQENERREKAWEQRRNEEAARQDAAQWQDAAGRFLADKNKGRQKPVQAEELLEEVRLSGMHLSNMAPERIFDKAWRVMTYDDAGQTATQDLMTRLRAPTAKVQIPGAPSTSPPPAAKPKEPDFGNLRMSDIVENIPITRNL